MTTAVLVGLFAFFGRQPSSSGNADPEPVDPYSVYDPIVGGESFPGGIRWVISRDGIRPVYDPVFVSAGEAGWEETSLVVGIEVAGEARAYPVGFLSRREMVNDSVAGVPVLVAWCPLCGTATVHRREIDGRHVLFGNQGALWGNAMTWWDHETGSIWSQPLGEAIAGPLKGSRLELLPSALTTWSAWRDAHPHSLALDVAPDQSSVRLDTVAIVVEFDDDASAYPVRSVIEAGVVNDVVAGQEIAVVVDPMDENQWAVFSRRVDDRVVALFRDGEVLRDVETGSVWDPVTGRGVSGELEDEVLSLRPASTVFPKDFSTFWPEGTLWEP